MSYKQNINELNSMLTPMDPITAVVSMAFCGPVQYRSVHRLLPALVPVVEINMVA